MFKFKINPLALRAIAVAAIGAGSALVAVGLTDKFATKTTETKE